MAIRKVRAGSKYVYEPVGCDVSSPANSAAAGQVVEVKNLRGCPPSGTMGHCHVVVPGSNILLGLVLCNSLRPLTNAERRKFNASKENG